MFDRDLTNVQFPMLNSYPNRGRPHESERFSPARLQFAIVLRGSRRIGRGFCRSAFGPGILSTFLSRGYVLTPLRG